MDTQQNKDANGTETTPGATTPIQPLPSPPPRGEVETALRKRAEPVHDRLMKGDGPASAARRLLKAEGLTEATLHDHLVGYAREGNRHYVVLPDLCDRHTNPYTGVPDLDTSIGEIRLQFDPDNEAWVLDEHGRHPDLQRRFGFVHDRGGALYPLDHARGCENALFLCEDPVEALRCRQRGLNAVAVVGGSRPKASPYDLSEALQGKMKGVVILRYTGADGRARVVDLTNVPVRGEDWFLLDLPPGKTLATALRGTGSQEEQLAVLNEMAHPAPELVERFGGLEGAKMALSKPGRIGDLPVPVAPEPDGTGHGLRFETGADLAETPDAEPEFIAEYVPADALVDFVGLPKAGKSTLVLALVRAVVKGQPFLGRPTKQGPIVYLTEQSKASFRETAKRVGLLGCPDLHVLYYGDTIGTRWPDVFPRAIQHAKRVGARLIVVDTLPQWAGLTGDAENNAGDALAAVRPLQEANARGIAVVVNRHERKGGGSLANSGRGSGAFAGAMDVIVRITKPEGNADPKVRVLEAVGRYDVPPEAYVSFDHSGTFQLLGDRPDYARGQTESKVLNVLIDAGGPLAVEAIRTRLSDEYAVRKSRSTLDKLLAELAAEGKVIQAGTGVKGDPFTYRVR